jgi:hypothetical protein
MASMEIAMETEDSSLPPSAESCTCCGRTDRRLKVRLWCHPEIALCDRCLFWLNTRRLAALWWDGRDRVVQLARATRSAQGA